MLYYNDYSIKNAITHYDQLMRGLEKEAEVKGYPIDDDITYVHACKMITNIEMNKEAPPALENWIMLGYYYGMVKNRILHYRGQCITTLLLYAPMVIGQGCAAARYNAIVRAVRHTPTR